VPSTARELRDHAMVAMLIGCGLRRAELLALRLESIQQREEHWVIADLVGKAAHVRTVPIPTWVKAALNTWTTAAAITDGPVAWLRCAFVLTRAGQRRAKKPHGSFPDPSRIYSR
jgi:site-specific recombinase XerC